LLPATENGVQFEWIGFARIWEGTAMLIGRNRGVTAREINGFESPFSLSLTRGGD